MLTFLPTTSASRIAEQPLRGGAERLDGPLLVDDDGRVGNGVEDRAEMRLARPQILRVLRLANPVRRSCSPNQEMPTPTMAKMTVSSMRAA